MDSSDEHKEDVLRKQRLLRLQEIAEDCRKAMDMMNARLETGRPFGKQDFEKWLKGSA
jgi:hypothetical protein